MLHDPEHITALMSGLSVCMLFICVPAFFPPNRKEFPCQDLAQASKDLDPPTQALTWCSSGWIEIRSNLILFLHNYFMDSGWLFVSSWPFSICLVFLKSLGRAGNKHTVPGHQNLRIVSHQQQNNTIMCTQRWECPTLSFLRWSAGLSPLIRNRDLKARDWN